VPPVALRIVSAGRHCTVAVRHSPTTQALTPSYSVGERDGVGTNSTRSHMACARRRNVPGLPPRLFCEVRPILSIASARAILNGSPAFSPACNGGYGKRRRLVSTP